MDQKDEMVYHKVKETLLQAFASSKGPLGMRALAPQWQKGQTVAQFVAQQQRLIRQWLQDCTIAEVAAKITMVQTEQALPYACQNYLHACKPKTPTELVTEVEHFFSMRGLSWSDMGNFNKGVQDGNRTGSANPPLRTPYHPVQVTSSIIIGRILQTRGIIQRGGATIVISLGTWLGAALRSLSRSTRCKGSARTGEDW
jgi:hypothetical protein